MFAVFAPFSELICAFSTKTEGDMKLKDASQQNLENRARYFQNLGLTPESVTSALAIHGADVASVGVREAGANMRRVDGLLTSDPGVFLSVTGGDCLIVYCYDPMRKMIALVHAGWKGLARGIVSKVMRQFEDPGRVRVAIGPFVQSCHFEVKDDVARLFDVHPEARIDRGSKIYIDLGVVAWRQLLEAGVKSEYTEISSQCTACLPDQYFSYRRDGDPLRVMAAVFGVKKTP